MRSSLRNLAGAVLLAAASSASATVATWNLEGVSFGDGATATGYFTLDDAAPGFLQALSIQTSAVGSFPAGEYTLANLVGSVGAVVRVNQLQITSPTAHLALTFSADLLDCTSGCVVAPAPAGAVNALTVGSPQNYEFLYNTTQELRTVAAGGIVAVPEPSSGLLFSLALATLGGLWFVRRARSERGRGQI